MPLPAVRRSAAAVTAVLTAAFSVLFLVAVAGPASTVQSASAATPSTPPDDDPFYRYTGSTPLSQIAPGAVTRKRSVTVALDKNSTPLPALQLQYRTTDELGAPIVSVTTVIKPATAAVVPHVVAYLSFYDALGSQCDPSYTLRGGDPGSANQQNTDIEQTTIYSLVTSGNIVTVPDFEDPQMHYIAGHESGKSSLDAVKATLSALSLPAATPVGLMGYSGGSIGSEWASELAPTYAPTLNIVGVAEGGIPVDLAHNLRYIDGSAEWSDVIPASIVALGRSYDVDLNPYLSAYGKKITSAIAHQCIGDFLGAYPNLQSRTLLAPPYTDMTQIPVVRRIINDLIMGTVPGHPAGPLFILEGKSDATGDNVMVHDDVEALAYEYCHQGVSVDFETSPEDHTTTGGAFLSAAQAYLASRFAGVPAPNNCASIGPGNSLAPVGAPSNGSPSPSGSSPAPGPSSAQASAAGAATGQAAPAADTAIKVDAGRGSTDAGPWLWLAGLGIVSAIGGLAVRRVLVQRPVHR